LLLAKLGTKLGATLGDSHDAADDGPGIAADDQAGRWRRLGAGGRI